ncbi:hypothetical protein BLOT_009978 [Blomia tropicalis]|nr:hypothetical protein BLOT_009978 [Blomia tropicalis]
MHSCACGCASRLLTNEVAVEVEEGEVEEGEVEEGEVEEGEVEEGEVEEGEVEEGEVEEGKVEEGKVEEGKVEEVEVEEVEVNTFHPYTLFNMSLRSVRTRDGFINLYENWLYMSPTMRPMLTDRRRELFINYPTEVLRNVFGWCRYRIRELQVYERGELLVYSIEETDYIILHIRCFADAVDICECATFLNIELLVRVSFMICLTLQSPISIKVFNFNVSKRFLSIHCQLTSLI